MNATNGYTSNRYASSQIEIRVSNYDRVSAWLLALIIVSGTLFVIMGMIPTPVPSKLPPPQLPPPPDPIGGGMTTLGSGFDADNNVDPSSEVPELSVTLVDTTVFDKVTEAVSRVNSGTRRGKNSGTGNSKGPDDVRKPGTPPVSTTVESQRWKVHYQFDNIEHYASHLRFFKIEIGVLSKQTNEVWRISDVGHKNRLIQSDRKAENKTFYLVPADAQLIRWDKHFVEQTAAKDDQTILVHFMPENTVELLRKNEITSLPAGRLLDEVVETHFKVVNNGHGFDFEVTGYTFK